jgi:hypothetical protein
VTGPAGCGDPPRMPWNEACAVSERHHLIKLVREGIRVSEAARTLGISRKTAYFKRRVPNGRCPLNQPRFP